MCNIFLDEFLGMVNFLFWLLIVLYIKVELGNDKYMILVNFIGWLFLLIIFLVIVCEYIEVVEII